MRRRFAHCRQDVDTLGWELHSLPTTNTQATAATRALNHIYAVLTKLY